MSEYNWLTIASNIILLVSILFMALSFIFNGIIGLKYEKVFENIYSSKLWRVIYVIAKILSFVSSFLYIQNVYTNEKLLKIKTQRLILLIFTTLIILTETILSCIQIFRRKSNRYIDLSVIVLMLLNYACFGLLFLGDIYNFFTKNTQNNISTCFNTNISSNDTKNPSSKSAQPQTVINPLLIKSNNRMKQAQKILEDAARLIKIQRNTTK